MPKILITGFCDFPAGNGRSVQLSHVVDALGRDHVVDMLVVRRGEQAYVESLSGAGRLLRVPIPDGDFTRALGAFRRAVRRQLEGADYEIVQFCDPYAGSVVIELARKHGFATVYDVARAPLTELSACADGSPLRREHEVCSTGADLVLLPHEQSRKSYARFGADKVFVVPPGVDVDTFDWEEVTKEEGRVLYLGTIHKGCGLELLVEAWKGVIGRRPDAHLIMVGRAHPTVLNELREQIRTLKLEDTIDIQSEMPHEQVPGLLACVNVCVAPNALELSAEAVELYPTKLLEYLACRRATVAPRGSTVELLCRDQEHAILFAPGDPLSLADAIVELIGNSKLAGRLGQAGYDLVRGQHTASNTRRLLRRAFDWLCKKEPFATEWANRERLAGQAAATPGAQGGGTWSSSIGGAMPENTGDITATGAAHIMMMPRLDETVPEPDDGSFVAGEFEVPTPDPGGPRTQLPGPIESVEFASEPEEKTVVYPHRSRPDPE